jgi:hypothetical protein
MNSSAFVCILSNEAINHPDKDWQNFGKLAEDSRCDNVFLEHRLALELKQLGLLDFIYTVFIGNPKGTCTADPLGPAPEYEAWSWDNLPNTPDTHVKQVEEKLVHHMESMALGMPLETNKTVKDVLSGITANQGFFLQGEGIEAFEKATNEIIAMIETSDQVKVSAVKDESSLVAEINDLKAEIAIRDNEISQRDAEIAQNKADISQRDNDIALRDNENLTLKADISVRDNENLDLKAEIASLRALLSSGTLIGGSATVSPVSIDKAALSIKEQRLYDKVMIAWQKHLGEKEN